MPNIHSSSLLKKKQFRYRLHLNKIRMWKIYNNILNKKGLMKNLEKKLYYSDKSEYLLSIENTFIGRARSLQIPKHEIYNSKAYNVLKSFTRVYEPSVSKMRLNYNQKVICGLKYKKREWEIE